MTQVDVLALMQEGGIDQDGQPSETDQRGGIADEVNIALIESCCPTAVGSKGVILTWPLGSDSIASIVAKRRRVLAVRTADAAGCPPRDCTNLGPRLVAGDLTGVNGIVVAC
jgi:hypothetical protein